MKRHIILCMSRKAAQTSCSKPLHTTARFLSTQEAIERRHHLFTLEKKRQIENVGRIEKIEVQYKGVPKNCTLIMNKGISTPYDCARHLTEWHMQSSALALLDGSVYWDMHRPLTENCTLELQNFSVAEPQHVNKAFWRSCSFLLGAGASQAFKTSVPIKLHSFPGPDLRSGSFIYDVELPSLAKWQPQPHELTALAAECVKLARKNLALERLDVSEELALEMFAENEHKTGQIPDIARANGKVTLYRAGQHVDISRGPMVASSGQVGRFAVTAVHALQGESPSGPQQLYRLQGVALPSGVRLNHFAFSVICNHGRKLNPARSPLRRPEETSRRVSATA